MKALLPIAAIIGFLATSTPASTSGLQSSSTANCSSRTNVTVHKDKQLVCFWESPTVCGCHPIAAAMASDGGGVTPGTPGWSYREQNERFRDALYNELKSSSGFERRKTLTEIKKFERMLDRSALEAKLGPKD